MTNAKPSIAFLGFCLAVFMVSFNLATTHLFTPHIQQQLQASSEMMRWMLMAFMFTFIPTVLVAGSLADHFGGRIFMLLGTGLFTLACVGNSCSFNIVFMIAMHGLQGLAAGLLWAALFANIVNHYQTEKLNSTLAMMICVFWFAVVCGFLATLLLHAPSSWRWLSAINIPFAFAAFIICWFVMPKHMVKGKITIDYLGIILLTLAAVSLVFSVYIITAMGFANLTTEISLFVFVVLLMLFVWREFSCDHPVMRLPMLMNSLFFASLFVRSITIFAFIALLFLLKLFYLHIHHLSEIHLILFYLPLFVTISVFAFIGGYLCRLTSPITIMLLGLVIIIIAFWLIANQENYPLMYLKNAGQLILAGAGFGMVFCSNTIVSLRALPKTLTGLSAAVLYFLSSLVALLSTPICYDIAKSGAITSLYANFLRLGITVDHWQQTQLAIANFHLHLEHYVQQHYAHDTVRRFIPPVNHLYAHSFTNASTLIIVLLLISFAFMALVAAGRK